MDDIFRTFKPITNRLSRGFFISDDNTSTPNPTPPVGSLPRALASIPTFLPNRIANFLFEAVQTPDERLDLTGTYIPTALYYLYKFLELALFYTVFVYLQWPQRICTWITIRLLVYDPITPGSTPASSRESTPRRFRRCMNPSPSSFTIFSDPENLTSTPSNKSTPSRRNSDPPRIILRPQLHNQPHSAPNSRPHTPSSTPFWRNSKSPPSSPPARPTNQENDSPKLFTLSDEPELPAFYTSVFSSQEKKKENDSSTAPAINNRTPLGDLTPNIKEAMSTNFYPDDVPGHPDIAWAHDGDVDFLPPSAWNWRCYVPPWNLEDEETEAEKWLLVWTLKRIIVPRIRAWWTVVEWEVGMWVLREFGVELDPRGRRRELRSWRLRGGAGGVAGMMIVVWWILAWVWGKFDRWARNGGETVVVREGWEPVGKSGSGGWSWSFSILVAATYMIVVFIGICITDLSIKIEEYSRQTMPHESTTYWKGESAKGGSKFGQAKKSNGEKRIRFE